VSLLRKHLVQQIALAMIAEKLEPSVSHLPLEIGPTLSKATTLRRYTVNLQVGCMWQTAVLQLYPPYPDTSAECKTQIRMPWLLAAPATAGYNRSSNNVTVRQRGYEAHYEYLVVRSTPSSSCRSTSLPIATSLHNRIREKIHHEKLKNNRCHSAIYCVSHAIFSMQASYLGPSPLVLLNE
jgi:hypothetical protein